MKKFASVLLAVLVAFSMFSFVVSAAAPKLTVSADKTTVKAGDVVTVTVALSEKSGLGVLTIKVNYDSTAFEAVEMKAGDLGATVNVANAVATMATAETFEQAGTVCTLKLKAIKAVDSTISVSVTEAVDNNFNAVTVDSNSVAIKAASEPTTNEPTTNEPTTDEPSTDEPSTDCKDHQWSTWATTKTATCKEAGVKTRNCKICGEEETEAIPATGNCEYVWVEISKPTATTYGEKQLKCKMCGDVKETVKTELADKEEDTLTSPSIPNTDAIA